MRDPAPIRERLESIRTNGYAWTDQELDIGVNGLAVGLFEGHALVATVSLFGPDYRFSASRLPHLAAACKSIVTKTFTTLSNSTD